MTIVLSIIIITGQVTLGDWKEDAEAIDISGGENDTLVLTQNKWACGMGFVEGFGLNLSGNLV